MVSHCLTSPLLPIESTPQVSPPDPHPVLLSNQSSAHHGKGHPHPATPGRCPQLGFVSELQALKPRSHLQAPGQSSTACREWKGARESKREGSELSKGTIHPSPRVALLLPSSRPRPCPRDACLPKRRVEETAGRTPQLTTHR